MNKFVTTGLALSTMFFGAMEAKAATFVIDSFDQEDQRVTVNITNPSSSTTAEDTSDFNTNILGGFRTISVEAVNPQVAGEVVSSVAKVSFFSSNGQFSISSPAGIAGLAAVTYDANGNGLSSLDLTETGKDANAFSLDVLSIDLTGELQFTVTGNNGETASLSKSGIEPGLLIFDFEDFSVTSGTGTLDGIFSDVNSISFTASGPAEFDATFDNIEAVKTGVPESSSVLSLIGLATLVAGAGLKNRVGKKS